MQVLLPLDYVPIAAITNYHSLGGENDTNVLLYSPVGQKHDLDLTGIRTGESI